MSMTTTQAMTVAADQVEAKYRARVEQDIVNITARLRSEGASEDHIERSIAGYREIIEEETIPALRASVANAVFACAAGSRG